MRPIVGEIVIERPVEEVFEVVADERNEPVYNPRLVSGEKTSSGLIGVGKHRRAETTRGRGRIPMTIDVTAYDRPRRLASRTRLAGMEITGELSFRTRDRRDPDGVALASAATRPAAAARTLIARQGARQEQVIWSSLKHSLEAARSSWPADGANVGPTS